MKLSILRVDEPLLDLRLRSMHSPDQEESEGGPPIADSAVLFRR
jgi:hypothetical protein